MEETQKLMAAIKRGSGNLSNAKIEKALNIGKEAETGTYSGRYFGRYLNATGTGTSVAMQPIQLANIVEKARELKWLTVPMYGTKMITAPDEFKHLATPDGVPINERIVEIRDERNALKKAQLKAVKALNDLAQSIRASKHVGFVHNLADDVDGETVNVPFEGFGVDLERVTAAIETAFLLRHEHGMPAPVLES